MIEQYLKQLNPEQEKPVKETEGEGKHRVVRTAKAMEAYDGNFLDKVTETAYNSMSKALTRVEERLVMPEEED